MNLKKTVSAIVVLVVAVGIVGYGMHEAQKKSEQVTAQSDASQKQVAQNTSAPTTPTTPSKTTTPAVADTTKRANKYKNGTYSATGNYNSPSGYESIGVSITIANDIVTASTVTPETNSRTSLRYQEAFVSGYKSYVIGKNIDTIVLDRVSGSSLTPAGFNNALDAIKSEAQA